MSACVVDHDGNVLDSTIPPTKSKKNWQQEDQTLLELEIDRFMKMGVKTLFTRIPVPKTLHDFNN